MQQRKKERVKNIYAFLKQQTEKKELQKIQQQQQQKHGIEKQQEKYIKKIVG